MEQKVTACLITWKRQYNIPRIIESLLKWSFVGQICLLDNSRGENLINYGRYVQAEKAQNEIIYTQDDDCIINNLGNIFDTFIKKPDTLCYGGNTASQFSIPKHTYGNKQMAMAGWGSFFKKEWIVVLDKYIQKYGKDYCFYRETDRIFTMLLKKHHNFVLGDITHLPGKDDKHALCQQPDHIKYKKIAIERCLTL